MTHQLELSLGWKFQEIQSLLKMEVMLRKYMYMVDMLKQRIQPQVETLQLQTTK